LPRLPDVIDTRLMALVWVLRGKTVRTTRNGSSGGRVSRRERDGKNHTELQSRQNLFDWGK